MKKTTQKRIAKNTAKFFKRFIYRMLSKILEMATLIGIGYALGLKLVRY